MPWILEYSDQAEEGTAIRREKIEFTNQNNKEVAGVRPRETFSFSFPK